MKGPGSAKAKELSNSAGSTPNSSNGSPSANKFNPVIGSFGSTNGLLNPPPNGSPPKKSGVIEVEPICPG